MELPQSIRNQIEGKEYQIDETGMSGSRILLFSDMVLKVQRKSRETEQELCMMEWLQDRLPVPGILVKEESGKEQFLLMSRLEGEMMCEEIYMGNPVLQTKVLAEGLKRLWAVDLSGCPADCRLDHKLMRAAEQVEQGLVDLDNVEPDTFGPEGFRGPKELLDWLFGNRPEEEAVLSHGDYCLPNVFGKGDRLTGYLDLGRAGIADKWCDIALCYRSLSQNYSGRFHGKAYSGYDDLLLFKELGIAPDWEKIRYYILLDELF